MDFVTVMTRLTMVINGFQEFVYQNAKLLYLTLFRFDQLANVKIEKTDAAMTIDFIKEMEMDIYERIGDKTLHEFVITEVHLFFNGFTGSLTREEYIELVKSIISQYQLAIYEDGSELPRKKKKAFQKLQVDMALLTKFDIPEWISIDQFSSSFSDQSTLVSNDKEKPFHLVALHFIQNGIQLVSPVLYHLIAISLWTLYAVFVL